MVSKEKAVIVCTSHRGVFFGYVPRDLTPGSETIILSRARMCIYWSEDMKGIFGLASKGPSATCRIGEQVPEIELRNVTAILLCSTKAAEQWEKAPWKA